MLADEPTGALDSRTGTQVLDVLRETARRLGQTVVVVTHDPRVAAAADRVLFLADGRLVDHLDAPTAERDHRAHGRAGPMSALTATDVTPGLVLGPRPPRQPRPGPFLVIALAAALLAATGRLLESGLRASGTDGDTGLLAALAGSFAGTALVVVVLVVASTVTLALRQRRRELALLRAVGATRSQVRRAITHRAAAGDPPGRAPRRRARAGGRGADRGPCSATPA